MTSVAHRERLDELAADAGREIALATPIERVTLVRRFLAVLADTIRAAAERRAA